MSQTLIQSADEKDLIEIANLHQQVFLRQINSHEWIKCNFKAFPRIMIYVILIDSIIIGYIQWIQKSGFRKEVVLELEQITILPQHQRKGFGRMLIEKSLAEIKIYFASNNRLLKSVIVSTRADNPAQKIYEKVLGVKVVGIISDLYSNDEVFMIAGIENSLESTD